MHRDEIDVEENEMEYKNYSMIGWFKSTKSDYERMEEKRRNQSAHLLNSILTLCSVPSVKIECYCIKNTVKKERRRRRRWGGE